MRPGDSTLHSKTDNLLTRVFHGTTRDIEGGKLRYDPNEYMPDRALGVHWAADPEVSNSFVMERYNGQQHGPKEGGRIIPGELDPNAKFLDVVLFNYGRCLFRMGKKNEARSKFDQLISEYPQSPLAGDAKKISDALAKASAG